MNPKQTESKRTNHQARSTLKWRTAAASFVLVALISSVQATPVVDEDAAARAIHLDAGTLNTCAVYETGNVDCSGGYWDPEGGRTWDYRGGDAVKVATGPNDACVLTRGGEIHCEGPDADRLAELSDSLDSDITDIQHVGGRFCMFAGTQFSCERGRTGFADDLAFIGNSGENLCALLDGKVRCDADTYYGGWNGQAVAIEGVQGRLFVLTDDGRILVEKSTSYEGGGWYEYPTRIASETDPGPVASIDSGFTLLCLLYETADVECFDQNLTGDSTPLLLYSGGDATAVAVGNLHMCVLREAGDYVCQGAPMFAPYDGGITSSAQTNLL